MCFNYNQLITLISITRVCVSPYTRLTDRHRSLLLSVLAERVEPNIHTCVFLLLLLVCVCVCGFAAAGNDEDNGCDDDDDDDGGGGDLSSSLCAGVCSHTVMRSLPACVPTLCLWGQPEASAAHFRRTRSSSPALIH